MRGACPGVISLKSMTKVPADGASTTVHGRIPVTTGGLVSLVRNGRPTRGCSKCTTYPVIASCKRILLYRFGCGGRTRGSFPFALLSASGRR